MALDPLELVIIAVIIVVVVMLGPKKIPELARALGSAKKEFNTAAQATPSAAPNTQANGDDVIVAAKRLGISTEGKTRAEISSEIVRKTASA